MQNDRTACGRRFPFVVFPDSDAMMIRIFHTQFNKYFKSVEMV